MYVCMCACVRVCMCMCVQGVGTRFFADYGDDVRFGPRNALVPTPLPVAKTPAANSDDDMVLSTTHVCLWFFPLVQIF